MTYFVDLNLGRMENIGNRIKYFFVCFLSHNKFDLTENFPCELWQISDEWISMEFSWRKFWTWYDKNLNVDGNFYFPEEC
jgi:hypothetical protein